MSPGQYSLVNNVPLGELGHSNKMVCFWSPARMYFKKFPQNIIIIIAVVVPYFLYTKAH